MSNKEICSLNNSFNSVKEIKIFHRVPQVRPIRFFLLKADYIYRLCCSRIKMWKKNTRSIPVKIKLWKKKTRNVQLCKTKTRSVQGTLKPYKTKTKRGQMCKKKTRSIHVTQKLWNAKTKSVPL